MDINKKPLTDSQKDLLNDLYDQIQNITTIFCSEVSLAGLDISLLQKILKPLGKAKKGIGRILLYDYLRENNVVTFTLPSTADQEELKKLYQISSNSKSNEQNN